MMFTNIRFRRYGWALLIGSFGLVIIYSYGFLSQATFLKKNLVSKLNLAQLKKMENLDNIMPVVIIGSGPAGLAAGVYTVRAGLPTLIIEGHKPGGLLTETTYIENWPGEPKILGRDLMARFKQQNQQLGVNFLSDQVDQVDLTVWPYKIHTSDGVTINALSVIVATGATPRRLGLSNEQQYWAKGLSSCAVCDAPFFKNKNVVVVGGGDSACEQVLQLAPHVHSVTMLVRKDVLRASMAMQDKVAAIGNAKIRFNTQITKILGDEVQVNGVELQDQITKQTEQLDLDGIFLAIGHDPATKIFQNQLTMDHENYLILKANTQKTSKTGVFAAGEVVDRTYRQAGVASGDGIKAALETVSFLQDIGLNQQVLQELQAQFFTLNKKPQIVLQKIKTLVEFEDLVVNSKLPVVLDFYTDYCSACLHMLPAYEVVAGLLQDKMHFFKVDASESEELVRKLKVQRVPTFVIYQNGELVAQLQEVLTKKEMLDLFGKYTQ